eukprot:CAMPEP_0119541572 /NCGR_PEP_ID=MMETSP1344-20130328/53030_1 /TAXON_ID=236787 /ORGANISM="Florenciella parvula, Strain CCMP2471" /LENGTH=409 /DNA_ID=CAMNT_0007585579 /DNA_START=57 /DNA_END=1286 /DNA_ORIENTATION=+
MRAMLSILALVACFLGTAADKDNPDTSTYVMHRCGFESDNCGYSTPDSTSNAFNRNSGATPSSYTGPSAAYEGSYYMHVEATGLAAAATVDMKTARMDEAIGSFSFYYHMYGTDIGTLKIQYSTDGSSWTTFSSISGNKGDTWNYYDSENHYWYYSYGAMYLRWYYTNGNSDQGDLAIDTIEVSSGYSNMWESQRATVYNDAGTSYAKIEGPETLGGSCPNLCSGHGDCYRNAKCNCFARPNGEPAWTAPDCSLRTCPKGAAWVAVATAANEAHPVVECSNKGFCNRKLGTCECFDNYDGVACERTVCPNDCNQNGICYTQKMLAEEASKTYATPWDAQKTTGCVCDAGYRGPDCSLQECPTGPDLMMGDGNEKGRDCSGRGLCDYKSGLCKCFTGYHGERCQNQVILS